MTDILQEASELINGERAKDYGDVTENFQRIANLWTDYLGPDDWQFTPHDVAMMMILVKMSRLATGGYHRDSLVDIAGYAALDAKLWDAVQAREAEVEAAYEKLAQQMAEGAYKLPNDFWGDIDESILYAQNKRDASRTSSGE